MWSCVWGYEWGEGGRIIFCKMWDFLWLRTDSLTSTLDFFLSFFGRMVPVYFILFTYFIFDHRVLMDKASCICPIYGPEWRGLWIQDQYVMRFDFHYKFQANLVPHCLLPTWQTRIVAERHVITQIYCKSTNFGVLLHLLNLANCCLFSLIFVSTNIRKWRRPPTA